MESVQPPADSRTSRVPAQRGRPEPEAPEPAEAVEPGVEVRPPAAAPASDVLAGPDLPARAAGSAPPANLAGSAPRADLAGSAPPADLAGSAPSAGVAGVAPPTVPPVGPVAPPAGPGVVGPPPPPAGFGALGPVAPGTAPHGPQQTVRPARPRRPVRRLLWVLVGALLALLLAGSGAFFVWYDRATTIDRSEPDVTVDNYLRAFLVDRNDARAQEFQCSTGKTLGPIESLRAEMEKREAQFHVVVHASWGALSVSRSASRAAVQATLTIASFANGEPRSRRTEEWKFAMMREDGWRVCGAERVG
ncbi:hypothetical protein ACFFWC_23735 [Plantactinospora siamensis]|uniref:Mce-associated membrane protein n=1 Tax=Plantactinospora siamensis TaxID=555372 RepID=A0ABV6P512_9ACTN